LSFGTGDFNGRQGSYFDLFLVVFVQLLGDSHGLLLHFDVQVGGHQCPVKLDDIADGIDQLLAEDQIGGPQVVLRDPNGAVVQSQTKALQQGLGDGQIEAGGGGRINGLPEGILLLIEVVEAKRDRPAGGKGFGETNSVVPERTVFDCGVVRCPQLTVPIRAGS
jgi:hypothetical protein